MNEFEAVLTRAGIIIKESLRHPNVTTRIITYSGKETHSTPIPTQECRIVEIDMGSGTVKTTGVDGNIDSSS